MKNSVYSENQSFWTWWLILLFIIIWAVQLQPLYESNWKIDSSSYVGLGILLAVLLFFLMVRLNTRIDEKGIHIRFFPFVVNKTWLWKDIGEVYIKEYSISDYGGWGYRVGRNGIAYNTKGKYGLQLLLKNGSHVMIGTQNPDQVQRFVDAFIISKS